MYRILLIKMLAIALFVPGFSQAAIIFSDHIGITEDEVYENNINESYQLDVENNDSLELLYLEDIYDIDE